MVCGENVKVASSLEQISYTQPVRGLLVAQHNDRATFILRKPFRIGMELEGNVVTVFYMEHFSLHGSAPYLTDFFWRQDASKTLINSLP